MGAVQFPVLAGSPDTPLLDPVCVTIGHLAAHWLNFGLSAKLLNMQPTSSEAVPSDTAGIPENVFFYDPGTTFVRNPLPAIYCWGDVGKERSEQFTMIKWLRTAEYHMRYYYKPLTTPKGRGLRSGVMTNAARLMHRMADEKRHRTFPPTGLSLGVDLSPNCSVESALCLRSLKIARMTHGTVWESPGQGSGGESLARSLGSGNDGSVQRGFPVLHVVWEVKEFVNGDQCDSILDETPDLKLTLDGSTGEGDGYVDIMERVLQAPDGTDDLCQKDEF